MSTPGGALPPVSPQRSGTADKLHGREHGKDNGHDHDSKHGVSEVHLPAISPVGSLSGRSSAEGGQGSPRGGQKPTHSRMSSSGNLEKQCSSSDASHNLAEGHLSRPGTASSEHEARRRASAMKMAGTSLHSSTRILLSDAFKGFTHGISPDAGALEKFQTVLVHAKESGMSLEKIFSFFGASIHDSEDTDIPATDFAAGIMQLNTEMFQLSDEEISELIVKFDLNKDKKISLSEFERFCLTIPHVSWRAEKLRMDQHHASRTSLDRDASRSLDNLSGSRRGSKDQPSHQRSTSDRGSGNLDLSGTGVLPHAESSPQVEVKPHVPEFSHVIDISKLMWRLRETLVARFYSYDGSAAPSCMAAVLHNETLGENYPTLYVDSSKVQVTDKAVQMLLADKLEKHKHAGKPELTETGLAKLTRYVRSDLAAQYVAARINLEEAVADGSKEASADGEHQKNRKVVILKLAGDEWDTLLMEKPEVLPPPPPFEIKRRTTFEDFQRTATDLEKLNQELQVQVDATFNHHMSPGSWKHHHEQPVEPSIPEGREEP